MLDTATIPRFSQPATRFEDVYRRRHVTWLRRGWGLLATLLALLLLWQLVAWAVRSQVLPGPAEVMRTLYHALLTGGLGEHLAISAYRVVVSIVIAVAVALPLGLAFGYSPSLYRLSSPVVYLAYPIPKIVLLPVLLMFLGVGDSSKVAMLVLILVFQIFIVVRDAARAVPPALVHSVSSLGARRLALLRYVFLPATLPSLLTALRISMGTAIAVLFFVESFGTSAGLGFYILVEGWGRLAYEEMYAGVVAMALLGMALYFILDVLERRVCRWVWVGK
ncbi:MAG: ABC transporter permease [Chloroflexi bacterium]|nr:ABC transporter permease [Chloroflexota bacterium]